SPAWRGFATYMPRGKLESAADIFERRNGDDHAQDGSANGNTISLRIGQRSSGSSRNFSHGPGQPADRTGHERASFSAFASSILQSYLSALRTRENPEDHGEQNNRLV
ncbi:hypothetical protein, partial [Pseudomonas aeruginosa]|uniref:hypothetical protein n=1 Tax=Pseudomonas aeruginosa TaxID=287 RepID=UPI003D2A2008